MKKPALIETTVRSFPDKDFDAATTRTTNRGHVTGRLCYSPLKRIENLSSRILKKNLVQYKSCVEIMEKARENGKSAYVVTQGAGVQHFNKLI